MMLRQAQHRLALIGALLLIYTTVFGGSEYRVRFIENKGQLKDTDGKTRNDILFYCDIKTGRVYFCKDGFSIVTIRSDKDHARPDDIVGREKPIINYFRYDVDLGGKNKDVKIKGSEPLLSYSNFYLSQCPNGVVHANEFSELVYENYFNDIDLVFTDNGKNSITYSFIEKNNSKIPSIKNQQANNDLVSCLPYCTYFGGTGNDEAWGITLDGANENSYTNGYTLSTDFPATVGSFQNSSNGNYDSFVIKMDSCGNRVWTTYIGGTANDFGEKIAMCGNTIVASGYTSSTDFPVSNASQANNNGSYDAYLFKLNAAGSRVWATYFGGSGGELGLAVAIDMNKNIFLGGSTSSTDMPVQNAFQNINNGPLDAFVAKFDSNGVRRWSTYYGGASSEDVHSMATDISGNIIVVGGTFSNDLSASIGAFQLGNNGGQDAYIIKFDSVGARIFSTYCGGFGNEDGYGVCTDAQKNIYLTGYTNSFDFPVTPGAFQFSPNTGDDLYIEKFSSTGAQVWCTFFGGSANEEAYAMTTDHNGHLFITGTTSSTNFPIIGLPTQNNNAGGMDNFILKFSTSGWPEWSTYYGGSLDEAPYDIASSPNMHLVLTGFTNSLNFPVTPGAFQNNSNGPEDAFITRLAGTFDVTLGQNENAINTTFNIFPVPADAEFQIDLSLIADENVCISLYDITGKEISIVQKGILKFGLHHILYDTHSLADGVYLLRFSGNTRNETKKIIISH